MEILFEIMVVNKFHFHMKLQSKNGGLAAWEPAGAAEWLEVARSTNTKEVISGIFFVLVYKLIIFFLFFSLYSCLILQSSLQT